MHLKPSDIDIDCFVSYLELLGEAEIRERYEAGQYEGKCYRVLVEGWLERKACEREAGHAFERLLRDVARSAQARPATLAPRALVLVARAPATSTSPTRAMVRTPPRSASGMRTRPPIWPASGSSPWTW
jgi:hypothetical protein